MPGQPRRAEALSRARPAMARPRARKPQTLRRRAPRAEPSPGTRSSAEFLQTPVMNVLRWMRVPGDTLFALGAAGLVLFVLQGGRTRSVRQATTQMPPAAGAPVE